jgi:hypothetical protein
MTVKEIMERANIKKTGKAIAFIKDGLEELNLLSETHVKTQRLNIVKNQRFYSIPDDAVKILDIRCKNHEGSDGAYKTIPRSISEPETEDADGI